MKFQRAVVGEEESGLLVFKTDGQESPERKLKRLFEGEFVTPEK